MNIFLLLCALLAPVAFANPQPTPKQLPSGAAVNIFLATPVFFLSSIMVSLPIEYLFVNTHQDELQHHPALWALSLLALIGAWSASRLMSSWGEERNVIAIRATALLVTNFAVQRYAASLGFYDIKHVANAITIGFVAAAACSACWRIIDRAYYPLKLIALATCFGAAPFVIAAIRHDDEVTFNYQHLLPDPHLDSTQTQIIGLLKLAIVAVSLFGIVVGLWRTLRWTRKGPQAPRQAMNDWPPQMGQVWQAKADRDDGGGWKVRPVLIWDDPKKDDRRVEVLQFTSQNKDGDDRYLPVNQDEWLEHMTKPSWLNLQITQLPKENLRCWACDLPQEAWDAALDAWRKNRVRPDTRNYEKQSTRRFFSTILSLWGDSSVDYYSR